MEKDRAEICKIITEMFDGVEGEIYPTSAAYNKLERMVERERDVAIGWTYADACVTLDHGGDPRQTLVPDILARAKVDLAVA